MSEFSSILLQSRYESIDHQLGYINPVCLLLGLINTRNATSPLFDGLNVDKLRRLSYQNLNFCYKYENVEEDTEIPLTLKSESVIEFCGVYQNEEQAEEVNGIYLLLGLTTFSNHASEILLKEGILFEDVVSFFQENRELSQVVEKADCVIQTDESLYNRFYSLYAKITPIQQHRTDYIETLYDSANTLFENQDMRSALKLLRQIVDISRSYRLYEVYLLMGRIYYRQKVISKAISMYQKAIKVNPEGMEAYFGKASSLSEAGDFDNSLTYYQTALALNP
ncbi:MAG: tetratricopeptide repeat protein, partial [Bacteroidota bacterium]